MATSLLITDTSTEATKIRVLNKISCIYYLVQFHKDKSKDILALLNSGSKINARTPTYIVHLGLQVRMTNISTQKIDKSSLTTYRMIIAAFQVVNKLGCSRFFQKTFLIANISIKVVLGMPFLTFNNVDI